MAVRPLEEASIMPWAPELFSAPVLARLEDNWWRENQLARAGFAVYVHGGSGKLDAARIYDDTERYA